MPVQLGVVSCEARPVNGSEIVPFTWVRSDTVAWQPSQASALRIGPSTTCFWCAPTARWVVSVSPLVPRGGAGFTPSVPWQAVQPPGRHLHRAVDVLAAGEVDRCRSASTVPSWQRWQSVFCGCGSGGGAPWQEPQAVGPGRHGRPGRRVIRRAAGASVAPWQYVEAQVAPFHAGRRAAARRGP